MNNNINKKTVFISILCLFIAFIIIQKIQVASNVVVTEKNLDRFPYVIGEYVANDIIMDDNIIRELNTDAYVFRNYTDKKGNTVTLYLGYYGTKKGGRSNHNPEACYPGAGWSILDNKRQVFEIPYDVEKRIVEINMMLVKKSESRELVYHWYQSNKDKIITSGFQQNIHRFVNRILYNRNDGAFIRISQTINDDLPETKVNLENFIRLVFPIIMNHWPEENEL